MKVEATSPAVEPDIKGSFRVAPERPGLAGIELEFTSRGTGDPIVLVHGGLMPGCFDLLAGERALRGYRKLSFHRPGYGGGPLPAGEIGLRDQAACCLSLLEHLGIATAHFVGYSVGACISLQAALDAPGAVRSLALIEPPVMSALTDRAGASVLRETGQQWQQGDRAGAVARFMSGVVDPGYRRFFAEHWPEGEAQVDQNAMPFFEIDRPGLEAWQFGAAEAARIAQPVLLLIGDRSNAVNPIRSQVHETLGQWLPSARPLTVPGATHLLPLQAPSLLATALVDFYGGLDA